ncbi:thioredoxin-like protein [Auriculariales sp. MPI-PUGE-AT-0066]|nr:thioredoxin-like protein [Auriculariales sp. MPI-PUGE-AT-0066]
MVAAPSNSASSSGPRVITLHQYSDFWCPWCYIGHREINIAVDRCKRERLPVEFQIEYKPFILAPNMSEGQTVPRIDYLRGKIGEEKAGMLLKLAADRCKTFGVANLSNGGPVCSTIKAHRLMQLAYKTGGSALQQQLCHRLFEAYSETQQNLSCVDSLSLIAEELDILPRDEARAWLEGTELEDDVHKLVDQAKSNGVTGVPFTIIDNKWAVGGGQSPDVYYQIFAKLAAVASQSS